MIVSGVRTLEGSGHTRRQKRHAHWPCRRPSPPEADLPGSGHGRGPLDLAANQQPGPAAHDRLPDGLDSRMAALPRPLRDEPAEAARAAYAAAGAPTSPPDRP